MRKSCFTFAMQHRLDLAELVSSRMKSLELKDTYVGKPQTWFEDQLGLYEKNQFVLSKGINLSQLKPDKHTDLRTPYWFGLNELDTLFDLKARGYDLNQKDSEGRTFMKKRHENYSKDTGEQKTGRSSRASCQSNLVCVFKASLNILAIDRLRCD